MYPRDDGYENSIRDRVYGQATGSSAEGRRSIAVVLFAVSVFLLIVSLSCRQATDRGAATNILEAGIASLTDVDQLIADEGPAIRQFALESEEEVLTIPDYPIDVQFTRDELFQSTDEQLRDLVLQRSADAVYDDGIEVFDRTGDQSLRRFSIQGVLEFSVNQVSASNHSRATFLAVIALLGCALFGAITAATGQGWGRMRVLGLAAAAGAVPCIVVFLLLRLALKGVGGDDPFVDTFRDVTDAVLQVPLRNALIVLAAGVFVAIAATALGRLEGMGGRGEVAYEGDEEW